LSIDESDGYSPLRKMPVVPDISPIQEAISIRVEPTPIKVEDYVRNESLQENSNNDFSLSDVVPKNLDPVFLSLEETNEFEKRIERNKGLMDQLSQITKRDLEYR
jgi:hypothetical protein